MTNLRKKAESVHVKTQDLCERLSRSQKFYFFGVVFTFIALFCYITPFEPAFFSVFITAGALFSFGAASDILLVYKKIWDTVIGKGLVLIIYAAATNVSYALASQVVNEIVAFESSKLIYATNFVAVMLIPLFALVFISAIFAVIFIFGQFYMLFITYADLLKKDKCLAKLIPQNVESHPVASFVARLIIFPTVLGFYWSISANAMPAYSNLIEDSAKAFIYNLEARKFSRCRLKEDQRAIPINDKEIVIAEKKGESYLFTPMLCTPKLMPHKTLDKAVEKSAAPVS